jgi:hypothetical protein
MFAMIYDPKEASVALPLITIGYLVLLFLVQWTSRSLAHNFLRSGLVTAVFAAWCGILSAAHDGNVHIQAGQAGVFLGSDAAGPLGRIAVLLVLGGVAISVMNSWTNSAASTSREEAIRANPQ